MHLRGFHAGVRPTRSIAQPRLGLRVDWRPTANHCRAAPGMSDRRGQLVCILAPFAGVPWRQWLLKKVQEVQRQAAEADRFPEGRITGQLTTNTTTTTTNTTLKLYTDNFTPNNNN